MKQINEVNLEEIFDKASHYMIEYDKQMCLKLMREACEQTVDLCAKNYRNANIGENEVSILSTKNQIV